MRFPEKKFFYKVQRSRKHEEALLIITLLAPPLVQYKEGRKT